MKILVFDPANSTGYAVMKIDGTFADICEYGFIDVDNTSDFIGDHCLDLKSRIQSLIDKHKPDKIALEDYFFSGKFAKGSDVNVAYRTVIHMAARENNLHYDILNISNWKKYIAGRTTPTKDQKKLWGKEAAKKLMMQQAMWEKWGFIFPNHSFSEKTGKPILFRYDIVDAVAMSVYYANMYLHAHNIILTVKPALPVVFKKISKKTFTYTSSTADDSDIV